MPLCNRCGERKSWVSQSASICAQCLRSARKSKNKVRTSKAAIKAIRPDASTTPTKSEPRKPPLAQDTKGVNPLLVTAVRMRQVPAPTRSQRSCTGSALPKVLALSEVFQDVISPHLQAPSEWPKNDRVLAWLWPNLASDVVKFHIQDGPSITRIFDAGQLQSLDNISVRKLAVKVERLSPGLVLRVRRLALDPGVTIPPKRSKKRPTSA